MVRFLLLLAFWGFALAEPVSFRDVQKAIQEAPSAVWVGSYLRNPSLAEALLKAYKGGVPVILVTSGYTYLDGRSYFLSLWFVGVPLFLHVPDEYILDLGARVFYGPGLGRGGAIYEATGEEKERKRAKVRELLRKARPFSYSREEVLRLLR